MKTYSSLNPPLIAMKKSRKLENASADAKGQVQRFMTLSRGKGRCLLEPARTKFCRIAFGFHNRPQSEWSKYGGQNQSKGWKNWFCLQFQRSNNQIWPNCKLVHILLPANPFPILSPPKITNTICQEQVGENLCCFFCNRPFCHDNLPMGQFVNTLKEFVNTPKEIIWPTCFVTDSPPLGDKLRNSGAKSLSRVNFVKRCWANVRHRFS